MPVVRDIAGSKPVTTDHYRREKVWLTRLRLRCLNLRYFYCEDNTALQLPLP
jgi:hypothetical protein